MSCFSPITIKNPKKMPNSKLISVPCGKCYHCRMKRRKDWSLRLQNELQFSKSAFFITLTYDDNSIPLKFKNQSVYEVLDKKHIQNYFKALRNLGAKFTYFAVGEYGTKSKRPHYHILMFNYDLDDRYLYECWLFGLMHVGQVEPASIHYLTKDMMKENNKKMIGGEKGFFLMSKGLGIKAIKKYIENQKTGEKSINFEGYRYNLPRYYAEKLFTDEQKLQQQQGINEMVQRLDDEMHQRLIERGFTDEFERYRYIEKERRSAERQEYSKLNTYNKI